MTCGPRCLRLFWEGSAGPRGCLPGGLAAGKDSGLGHAWVVWSMRGAAGLGVGCLFLTLPWAGMMLWILGMTFPMFQSFIATLGQMSDAVIYPAPLDMKIWA